LDCFLPVFLLLFIRNEKMRDSTMGAARIWVDGCVLLVMMNDSDVECVSEEKEKNWEGVSNFLWFSFAWLRT